MRQRLLARRATLRVAERQGKSAAVAAHVHAMPAFHCAHTVMVYMALAQEVQTEAVMQEARRQHKRVVIPVVAGSTLLARELPQDTRQLRRGPFGILEPCCTATIVRPEEIDCVFVPGVAFDRRGGRLGFGKGYYDRFLCQLPSKTFCCGLAFGIQIVPDVPRMPYDICMHYIVTEEGMISCVSNSVC